MIRDGRSVVYGVYLAKQKTAANKLDLRSRLDRFLWRMFLELFEVINKSLRQLFVLLVVHK
jgi:hypothetical protein